MTPFHAIILLLLFAILMLIVGLHRRLHFIVELLLAILKPNKLNIKFGVDEPLPKTKGKTCN